jgi:hypothetical protein
MYNAADVYNRAHQVVHVWIDTTTQLTGSVCKCPAWRLLLPQPQSIIYSNTKVSSPVTIHTVTTATATNKLMLTMMCTCWLCQCLHNMCQSKASHHSTICCWTTRNTIKLVGHQVVGMPAAASSAACIQSCCSRPHKAARFALKQTVATGVYTPRQASTVLLLDE